MRKSCVLKRLLRDAWVGLAVLGGSAVLIGPAAAADSYSYDPAARKEKDESEDSWRAARVKIPEYGAYGGKAALEVGDEELGTITGQATEATGAPVPTAGFEGVTVGANSLSPGAGGVQSGLQGGLGGVKVGIEAAVFGAAIGARSR